MLKKFVVLLFIFIFIGCFYSKASAEGSYSEVSNNYFSFTMPEDTKNIYSATKEGGGIDIFEKASKKEGKGGFAFGLKIYKNPKDYVGLEDAKKIGELTDKNGNTYDMVLIHPREIFYGDGANVEKNYNRLYNLAENLEIKGVGGAKYAKGKGTKGEGLYSDVLKQYKKTAEENWIPSYYKKAGYAYYDINSDGIDELFIGDIKKGNLYDIYTISDRKPVHVINGIEKLFVCNDIFICTDTVRNKNEKLFSVYSLERNSKKLNLFVKYMYNKDKNKANPWFRAYYNKNNYENISKKTYEEEKARYSDYKKFNYALLSKFE